MFWKENTKTYKHTYFVMRTKFCCVFGPVTVFLAGPANLTWQILCKSSPHCYANITFVTIGKCAKTTLKFMFLDLNIFTHG
jgi:hypothetical protein